MGHDVCCVVGCSNNGSNSSCKFFVFPRTATRKNQRIKWIAAVRRVNPDGSSWIPKPSHKICSAHFVGKKPSITEISPSYVPTIFPSVYKAGEVNEVQKLKRHDRFMERRKKRTTAVTPMEHQVSDIDNQISDIDNERMPYDFEDVAIQSDECLTYADKECQVYICVNTSERIEKTFICNSYTSSNTSCRDVEIQTEITGSNNVVQVQPIMTPKTFKNKKCGTPDKTYVDQSLDPISVEEMNDQGHFAGISSIKTNQQLLDLAGVTFNNFNFLFNRLRKNSSVNNFKVSKKDKLFIFLVKVKTGLTFSAIGVLFSVHRVTISRIFFSMLEELTTVTADLVFWPTKDVVQGTMPKCFYPDYSNTRVIIDCTEFKIEVPSTVDNRVFTYSHYKKGFTAKVLIGITPGGFISFRSKVAGGRKSDSQITIESGLIDLLENGDTVLADKGFPEIKKVIDEKGKEVILVMPPFLHKNEDFTKQETEQTYSIAKVRIHVERIMQRLRTYQILNKIPEHLFCCVDDILQVCCALVNLQPPIISDNDTKDSP
ncbi:hypothetical protein TSAR_010167 [Trichomalopsis sarcophagae]|uniref:THAP-type domain-containing protein n=1 Tax=Trichomalopsis sarcophagae TaxID=543379 RepID=A0A232ED33_9HYME|nr:hypothetical protein TSAR_010167 [Trichomalopsis sarcophagae]